MLIFIWYQSLGLYSYNDLPPVASIGKPRDVIILFWNTFWVHEWFKLGKGSLPYQKCANQNCLNTRNKSLLYDPNIIVDAILFHGVNIPLKELEEIKKFRENRHLVQKINRGIKPKIVLFLVVSK